MQKNIKIDIAGESVFYDINVGSGTLARCGEWVRSVLPTETQKIAIVSNKKVFGLYGATVKKSLVKAGFKVETWLMQDGEKPKNFGSLQNLLSFLSENKFTRGDAIVAFGGGVVGDLTGFAASIYLRGIPFLQIPTTLVSQIDSSVGGKTAVNTAFGKNLIGTFYQPAGVMVDVETLRTLPRRELTAGFCEAIKQGAISGDKLFDQTKKFLENYPVKEFDNGFRRDDFNEDLIGFITSQIAFKAEIVAGDQKEDLKRTDGRSRKILNFGHTIGHALEKVTAYKRLKHGEAVGYGILAAANLSKGLELLDENSLNLLSNVVRSAGKLSKLNNVLVDEVFQALAFDKKRSGKTTTWILLKKIGDPILVPESEIPISLIKKTIKAIL